MNSTWRDIAKPIIAETIAKYGCSNMHRLRKELNAVYPFHEKAMWPYKVWLDEIKVQTGTKKTKPKPPDEPLFALLQEQE